ncbi:BnaC02g17100D [Brassica napus]|uniref:BnaC02g17100D protein n=3 Tax=Brassica napus TaxID=3708 RepID=A0A078HZW6_BRANA|nr:BnaC02g17100D [Brassica napus]
MTGVSFHETTKAIQMDDEWWNDRIQEISDAAKLRAHPLTDIDRLDRLFGGKHISTDDDIIQVLEWIRIPSLRLLPRMNTTL